MRTQAAEVWERGCRSTSDGCANSVVSFTSINPLRVQIGYDSSVTIQKLNLELPTWHVQNHRLPLLSSISLTMQVFLISCLLQFNDFSYYSKRFMQSKCVRLAAFSFILLDISGQSGMMKLWPNNVIFFHLFPCIFIYLTLFSPQNVVCW